MKFIILFIVFIVVFVSPIQAKGYLPLEKTFIGEKTFKKLVKLAKRKKWSELSIGNRITVIGLSLRDIKYKGLTLEVDNYIESPSANFDALDCWTFFEISLCFARMLEKKKDNYTPQDLLDEIEFTRYRGGVCTGKYLDRIHYLAEWFFENEARGVAIDLTKEIGGIRMYNRKCQEMTKLWKYYPMLKNNKKLLIPMGVLEEKISNFPVMYYPKEKVKFIEDKIQNGDIIGIVTNQTGGFCSHVGIAVRTKKGTQLLHASSDFKKVVLDDKISNYLYRYKKNAGIIVSRPLPTKNTIRDRNVYLKNISYLVGGYDKMAVVPQVIPSTKSSSTKSTTRYLK